MHPRGRENKQGYCYSPLVACTWTIYIQELCNVGVCSKVLSPQLTLTALTLLQLQERFCSLQRRAGAAYLLHTTAAKHVLMLSESTGNDGQLWA